jgi:hypothetical protein
MVTPEELGERYLAVHHRMFRAVNDEMSGCGLSLSRTKVLMRLKEHGPTRQSVLAADFGMAPHSITDAGEVCLGVAYATRERLLTQIFGALDDGDRATLLRLLDRLDGAIKTPAEPGPAPVPASVPA